MKRAIVVCFRKRVGLRVTCLYITVVSLKSFDYFSHYFDSTGRKLGNC